MLFSIQNRDSVDMVRVQESLLVPAVKYPLIVIGGDVRTKLCDQAVKVCQTMQNEMKTFL